MDRKVVVGRREYGGRRGRPFSIPYVLVPTHHPFLPLLLCAFALKPLSVVEAAISVQVFSKEKKILCVEPHTKLALHDSYCK